MPSRRVVLFNDLSPYYLSGFRDQPSHLKGRVENGHWDLYIYKKSPDYWEVYNATSKVGCVPRNLIATVPPGKLYWIEIPEVLRVDYNTAINWARRRSEAERCFPRK